MQDCFVHFYNLLQHRHRIICQIVITKVSEEEKRSFLNIFNIKAYGWYECWTALCTTRQDIRNTIITIIQYSTNIGPKMSVVTKNVSNTKIWLTGFDLLDGISETKTSAGTNIQKSSVWAVIWKKKKWAAIWNCRACETVLGAQP